jgi:hypothetical protein
LDVNDLERRLRDADPLNHEPELSTATSQAIRQYVISAKPATGEIQWSPGPVVLALTIAFAMTLGILIGHFQSENEKPAALTSTPKSERQLQFETPGGTRIIWLLKSD